MPRDTNAEVEALQLDPRDLVGKHVDDIEARFAAGDVRLILADGALPAGWPREVRERTGPRSVDFRLVTAEGVVRRCTGVSSESSAPATAPSPLFGYLFTRRAVASPRVRIRPIVQLQFDFKGVCIHASAASAVLSVRVTLREMDVEAGRCAPLSFESVFGQKLAPAFGLAPPGSLPECPDFEIDARWRSRERFTFAAEPPAFRLDDATGMASLACTAESDGSATALPSRMGGAAIGAAVERAGHRFVASDGSLIMLAFMDLYAGDLGLVFRGAGESSPARRVRALLVASRSNEPEAESLAPGATIVLLLGSALVEWAPAENPAILVEPARDGLRLVAPGGAERRILPGRIEHAPGTGHVFAEIDET